MKIAVSSFGSEGDIRPYIALARGLRAAGHDAFLVAMGRFAARAADAGVPWRDNGMSQDLERYHEIMTAIMRQRNPMMQARAVFEVVESDLRAAIPSVQDAVRDADAVVHHHIDIAGYAAAVLQ